MYSAPKMHAAPDKPVASARLPAKRKAALNPSEYTSALIQGLHMQAAFVRDRDVLEIGSGSGVVLATMARLGARTVTGVDVEADAVVASRELLQDLGFGDIAEVCCGDMWAPFVGRRFDLIAANLPHFPMPGDAVPGRLPSWSAGGFDGRRLLDPFLKGLGRHLTEDGRAIVTHNGFLDLERTRALVAQDKLEVRELITAMVFIPPDKLARMTEAVLLAAKDVSIHRYGPYAFGEVKILEVSRRAGSPEQD